MLKLFRLLIIISICVTPFVVTIKVGQELALEQGYYLTPFPVVTEDGYILNMFRVTQDNVQISSQTPVVFLQHGIGDSSDAFLVNRQNSVAFLLKNAGYDVWLGNSRGNKYSPSHETLNQSDQLYWSFSYQELGLYDKKAAVNEVISQTGVQKVTYIGHSQGVPEMLLAITDDAAYWKDRLNLFVTLSPAVLTENLKTVNTQMKWLCYFQRQTQFLVDLIGVTAITRQDVYPDSIVKNFIKNQFVKTTVQQFTDAIVEEFDDPNSAQQYLDLLPAGTSFQSLNHLLQNCKVDQFQKYDYNDKAINFEKYGQETPPLIDLTLVSSSQIPVAIFTAKDDIINEIGDSRTVRDLISGAVVYYEEINGGHLTFMISNNMVQAYFQNVLNLLNQYNPV